MMTFFNNFKVNITDLVDGYDFALLNNLIETISNVVEYNQTFGSETTKAEGISLFIPMADTIEAQEQIRIYSREATNINYINFLNNYL
jgi:hypothetical protein